MGSAGRSSTSCAVQRRVNITPFRRPTTPLERSTARERNAIFVSLAPKSYPHLAPGSQLYDPALEEILEPDPHALDPLVDAGRPGPRAPHPVGEPAERQPVGPVQREARYRGKSRRIDRVDQPRDVIMRRPNADPNPEDVRGEVSHAGHRRRTAGEHHPSAQSIGIPGARDLLLDELEDLVHPLVDDVRQRPL